MDIYGTLGPSCSDTKTIEQMFRSGMTGMRLNLSHVTLEQASKQIEHLHMAAKKAGVTPKLLIDMQGPELRLGPLPTPVELTVGQEVRLGADGLPVPSLVLPCLTAGQEVLLDDGKLLLRVLDNTGTAARAVIIRGGLLRSRKSIALPGAQLSTPAMTESDLANIALAASYGVTGVMQPFVRSLEDLLEVRAALNAAGGHGIKLFAKIENLDGVNRLESLLPGADEIVIARGDLGNAVKLWQLPALQKKIAQTCRENKKAFMVVTQMLSSMENSPVPTRAELSDIFNAVLDGASSVMVTGETAVGKYPAEVIRYLANTVNEALDYMGKQR